MSIDIVLLAAGKGSRMKSDLPKVLHPVGNQSMLAHVIATAKQLNPNNLVAVIGHGSELVKTTFQQESIQWALQEQQLGTGHAVLQALPYLADHSKTLILYGDVPLIRADSLRALLASEAEVAILTAVMDNPTGYGRIIRNTQGVTGIVEQKDATEDELNVQEVNTGIMAVSNALLKKFLPKLSSNNAQQEYYLTDIVKMAVDDHHAVEGVVISDNNEVLGANDRLQLSTLEAVYRQRQVQQLMQSGATVIDPSRIDIWGNVEVGKDVVIEPNVVFIGDVKIGSNVVIEANCRIEHSHIGDNTQILSHSRIESSVIEQSVTVGPFARIRPNTHLQNHSKIGNFVETKKSTVGEGSKVNHLSYIGDCSIGNNVNVGAGTITCNYDGKQKHQTTIEDNAFIGSNTALVAPVTVGQSSLVGAGSTITKDVPHQKLAIARQKQINLKKKV